MNILFAAHESRWAQYEEPLRRALDSTGLSYTLATQMAPEDVDYIVYAPNSDVQDFTPYTRCKAVLNLWAGVEHVVNNKTLTHPLCRMVDDGLTQGMVEYVTGHVLRHHLGMDRYITGGSWAPAVPPLARDRKVTLLGLGALGIACAEALAALGFDVAGWSRRQKRHPRVKCMSGDELDAALERAEILVLLLPLTAGTESLLNAERLARLPQGAVVINPGRGALIDDDALLEALDAGQVGHATLDTFRVEPLPVEHPYWAHPQVTVTPHIASETRPPSASMMIAQNIARSEAGEPLLHVVDRTSGY